MDFLKNSQNKILVCIPAYNAQDCLSDTVKSILSQTFKSFDILIIDNQSNDNTAEVARQLKRDFDPENKIYIIENKENIGRVGNWNKCIEVFRQTSHTFIKFMVTGDTLEKNCLEALMDGFKNNPGVGLVSAGYYVHNYENKTEKKISFNKSMRLTPAEALGAFIKKGNWVGSLIACMFSRQALGENKFSEGIDWAADWKLYVDMLKKFDSFYISEPLSNFYAPRRKYYQKYNGTPVAKAEELFVARYALKILEDLDPDAAKNARNDLYKTEGKYLFLNLSFSDIAKLTVYKLAKLFKSILIKK
jgi:glycosyltransferase involved in cell wall biosynthesis